jgi:nucleoside phosphorylase
VLCAMPMELAPLARRLGLRGRSEAAGIRLSSGDPGGRPTVGAVIGIGPKQAAERTGVLLDALAVERVVVVGISGAPDGLTPIGTVIRPAAVVDGDTGAEYLPHPLRPAGDGDLQGKLWTSAVLNADVEAAAALLERGVVALDMETAAVARVCESRDVPWSVVRAISDRVSDGLVDQSTLALTRPDGKPDLGAAARYVLERPSRLGRMFRLARDSRAAAVAAAKAAAADLGVT